MEIKLRDQQGHNPLCIAQQSCTWNDLRFWAAVKQEYED